MNTRRSNRTLTIIAMIMGVVATIIIMNVFYTMITHNHFRSGQDILAYKGDDGTKETTVKASRGTIYDRNGEVIATDENTYSIIVYLNEDRKGLNETPAYVSDFDKTSKLLSEKLGMKAEDIKTILENAKAKGAYQTELGTKGKNLSASVKESIEALQLPGIEFTQTVERKYPNSYFASTLIGYAQYDEEQKAITGRMGLEETLNKYLTGKDGKTTSQKDKNGNTLPGTTFVEAYKEDGNDVYLTIDQNVQLALESLMKKTMKFSGKVNKAWVLAVEVETGKILGWSSYPSFDLNTRNDLKQYIDNNSTFIYEPGSVMKGVTYSSVLDVGKYPYNQKYTANVFYFSTTQDGKIVRVNSAENALGTIWDAEHHSMGTLTFDKGFARSSNIAICELLTNHITPEIYREYIDKFGFLKPVDTPFVKNEAGNINFNYPIEELSTGFGQSINVTALQMVQAYTAIFNDGKMMRPYVVDRIEDGNSHKVIEQYEPQSVGTPIKKETSDYVKKLMGLVVNDPDGTGQVFKMDDVDVIAKTGTGQISTSTGYMDGRWIMSVMAAAPADDPKIMMYYAFEGGDYTNFSREYFKDAMREALIAQGITGSSNDANSTKKTNNYAEYTMPSLVNHSLDYAKNKLSGMKVEKVIIGNGDNIISQYPDGGESIISNQNIFLMSDGTKITMPDMSGWTMKDITAFWKLTGIEIQMEGSGSVYKQSVKKGQAINADSEIKVQLK